MRISFDISGKLHCSYEVRFIYIYKKKVYSNKLCEKSYLEDYNNPMVYPHAICPVGKENLYNHLVN